jgi:hypothetical protein
MTFESSEFQSVASENLLLLDKYLNDANSLYETDPKRGVRAALSTVYEFCREMGIEASTLAPLTRVVTALEETDDGLTDPIFHGSPIAGRPPLGIQVLQPRVKLSIIVELCMRAQPPGGRAPLTEAIRVARELLRKHGYEPLPSANQLKNFRKALQSGGSDRASQTSCAQYEDAKADIPEGGDFLALANELAASIKPSLKTPPVF